MSNVPDVPMTAMECQQDMLRRLSKWLLLLEERIILLLHAREEETLKPGEREQAISRYLVLLLRLLQLRQQHAVTPSPQGGQALIDALLQSVDDV
jgi:hypothetical protein